MSSTAPASATAHLRLWAGLMLVAGPVMAQFRVEVAGVGMTQMPLAVAPFRGEATSVPTPAAIVQADLERRVSC